MIFSNDYQRNKYHQVWKEIIIIIRSKELSSAVNDGNGELKMHEKIRSIDSDLPIEKNN